MKNSQTDLFLLGSVVVVFLLAFTHNFFIGNGIFVGNEKTRWIEIKSGDGVKKIADELERQQIISSSWMFTTTVKLFGNEKKLSTGIYMFEHPLGIIEAENRISKGLYGIEAVKITIPEGFTRIQIAERFAARLPFFDKDHFLAITENDEGYLFPETYFFIPGISEESIREKLLDVFDDMYNEAIKNNPNLSNLSKADQIIFASVLEKEVKSLEDKKMVADILYSRMKIGMALQVDATLAYERDKDSYTLTSADLKKDSPYNTYTRQGLPPTAISNPGLNAIIATISPTANPYIYFLTDREGKVYYAKTYSEHLVNKAKYVN